MFDSKKFVSMLPNLPGVYRMLGEHGEVLYVGKARDLKKRVSSYFQKAPASPRTVVMVGQIAAIETTVTRSESEALLLENNLIKTLSPRYNILFRDDKSYPYIMLSGSEYGQIRFYRGSFTKPHQYFGPFPTAWAVRETIQHLQKVFHLRSCDDTVFKNRSRPCLLHQIKRCSGPCVKLIEPETYARDMENAKRFLEGRESEVIGDLTQRMLEASAEMRFEAAAALRDQIKTLQHILAKQFVSSGSNRDADIIAVEKIGATVCVNLAMVRGGRHLGDKAFFPSNAEGAELPAVLEAFITQHYGDCPAPAVVVVNQPIDMDAVQALLSESIGRGVRVTARPQAEGRTWLDMAEKNARLAISLRQSKKAAQEAALTALQEVFDLPPTAQRIECFDVSHTMGEATVASCVVFDDGKMQNSQYRRYNVSGITPGDDYAAMRDVLFRRYRKIAGGEGKIPDLVLIDGGRGQLNAAVAILGDLGLAEVPLVGVAKGEERKPGLEELIIAAEGRSLHLPKDHPALHLVQQIRDEAHRFAISGHRARRGKARTASVLEQMDSIGARRRQKLLTRFGGLQGVLSASVDDLANVEGISRKLAEKIYQQLH
ncbi:MAG: excinuclease ABC subunit UvrC [Burkholderiales bacterium]|nr:excinuclease ABC subunit UvrC [Burkholderiales bacterium]